MNETLTPDGNTRNVAGAVTDDSNLYIKRLRIDDTTKGLKVMIVGGAGSITTGTSAPNTTPSVVGEFFIDTSGKKAYVSMGTTNSNDWVILN